MSKPSIRAFSSCVVKSSEVYNPVEAGGVVQCGVEERCSAGVPVVGGAGEGGGGAEEKRREMLLDDIKH